MPVISTELLVPGSQTSSDNLQTYCGLDCCVTLEVYEELGRQWPEPPQIYSFSRALQAPYLEIMSRGFLVDGLARRQAVDSLRSRQTRLQLGLQEMARAVWGKGVNPRSPAQLREFFYSAMKLPEQWISQKGERKLAMNREVLEKLEGYLYARPIVASILSIRDIAKQLEVLETEIDSDGRFRASYNIAGTETGRPSSSTNAFGTGGNAQNIAPGLRYVFVADPGCKLCVIDLEQVEARDVGFFCGCLFDDWSFLDACESGDLHTNNAKLVWPERGWGGSPAQARARADEIFYRDFTYRDMAKRGGHLSNYKGTAWMMSRSLKIPQALAEEFQARYVLGRDADTRRGLPAIAPAFPCIPRWWQWTAQELQTRGHLTTPFGRTRHFFGRPEADETIREAVAFLPQSTTADRMNLGLWRVWQQMPEVRLLAQTYDSITFQYREDADEEALLTRALQLIRVPLHAPNGREYVVPGEAKIGWNWGAEVTQAQVDRAVAQGKKPPRLNPGGLVKWKPGKRDPRVRATGLQRIMHG